jgi:hypothetical protein
MMTCARVRFHCFTLASLALACAGVAGCHIDNVAPNAVAPPVDQMGNLGTYIVEVNLKTRVVTTHPLASGSLAPPRGVNAALYGAPGLITHVFQLDNGAPVGGVWTLRDRIENNQPFAIGTHVAHAAGALPADTMGVFVFLSINPVVRDGCAAGPTCTVAVDSSFDGSYPFTSPTPQPYMYFKTILEASDSVATKGLDFTDQSPTNGGNGIDYSRTLSFRASPGVTNFVFGVSVSAAWTKPNETRWAVTYVGDSLPNRSGTSLATLRSEPDWRMVGSTGVSDTSIANAVCAEGVENCFRIQNGAPAPSETDSLIYFRGDSLGAADNAFIEAAVAVSALKSGNPSVYLGMQDRAKAISFGIASDAAGFTTGANTFLPNGSRAVDPGSVKKWRVAKFGIDSVVAYADTLRVAGLLYSSLPTAPIAATPTPYFWFGNRVTYNATANPTNATSLWSTVHYEIGATSP